MPREMIEPQKGNKRYIRRKTSQRRALARGRPTVQGKKSSEERRGRSRRPEARPLKTKRVETLLRETKAELVAGEALLSQKKKAKKHAKSKLARSAKVLEKAVASIATHRKLLKRTQGVGDAE